jgi:multiple sugar transport system permease protein
MKAQGTDQNMRKAKSSIQRSENWAGILFALPTILGFTIFALGPMVASLIMSFSNYSVSSSFKLLGLANYRKMFSGQDPYFYKSLGVTLYYVAFSVPASVVFSFVIALLMNQKIRFKALFRTIYYLPSIVPVVAMSAVWVWILNPDLGLANTILKSLGLPTSAWLFAEGSVIPTMVGIDLWTIGSTMVIFLAALQDIPAHMYEAVEIDGGGAFARLIHITIPLMTPAIFFNLIIGFINGFQAFTKAYVMTGGGPHNASLFFILYLYREGFVFSRLGSACAIAWVLFLIIGLLSAVFFKTSKKWVYYGGE